jgi:transposase
VLQVDAYAGYNRLTKRERPGGPVTLSFCLAHARRKFFEIHKSTGCLVSAEALLRFAAIYRIEARIRGTSAKERLAVRQAETQALFDAFKPWLMDRLSAISAKSMLAKSMLAKAIRYALGHWNGLGVFLTDSRVEVDNNTVERTIRAIGLGRKNSLFAGSAAGGETWAILASLINSAKLHELRPAGPILPMCWSASSPARPRSTRSENSGCQLDTPKSRQSTWRSRIGYVTNIAS